MDDADEKMRNGDREENELFKWKFLNLSCFVSYQCVENSEKYSLD